MRDKHVRVLGEDTETRTIAWATKLDMTWLWSMVRDISTRRDGETASSAIFMHSVDQSDTSGEMRGSWRTNLDLVVYCTSARDASTIRRQGNRRTVHETHLMWPSRDTKTLLPVASLFESGNLFPSTEHRSDAVKAVHTVTVC